MKFETMYFIKHIFFLHSNIFTKVITKNIFFPKFNLTMHSTPLLRFSKTFASSIIRLSIFFEKKTQTYPQHLFTPKRSNFTSLSHRLILNRLSRSFTDVIFAYTLANTFRTSNASLCPRASSLVAQRIRTVNRSLSLSLSLHVASHYP